MAEKGVKMAMKMESALSDGFLAVRAGFVGSAWHFRAAAPAIRRSGMELMGINTPGSTRVLQSVLRCQDRQAELGVAYSVPLRQDAAALVRHDDIDVVIALGTAPTDIGLRRTETGRAAERANLVEYVLSEGKHIVTAPGADADEQRQLAAVAAQHPGQLCVLGMDMRFLETVHALRSLLHQGALGPLRGVRGSVRSPVGLRFCGDAGHTWWHTRRGGGGAIAALAPSFVDLLCHVSGAPVAKVQTSAVERLAPEKKNAQGILRRVTTEDRATLRLEMGSSPEPWTAELRIDAADAELQLPTPSVEAMPAARVGGMAYELVFEGEQGSATLASTNDDVTLVVRESTPGATDIEVVRDALGEDRTNPPGDLWDRRAITAAVDENASVYLGLIGMCDALIESKEDWLRFPVYAPLSKWRPFWPDMPQEAALHRAATPKEGVHFMEATDALIESADAVPEGGDGPWLAVPPT